MRFFKDFFKGRSPSANPAITFGRFSDTYKSEEQYQLWNKLSGYYEKGHYLKLYTSFFRFLENPDATNVTIHESKGRIEFTFRQGSGFISGYCDMNGLRAESIIAATEVLPLGLMRGLLEQNFNLKFCRYALDNKNRFCLIFDTFSADGPPHKLYQGLRELALEADRQDDLLIKDFPEIKKTSLNNLSEFSVQEKKIKYQFMKKWAYEAIYEIDNNKLNAYMYPGSISFILLDFLYKLDFLIVPEGSIKEEIRDLHLMFFDNSNMTVFEKNNKILKLVRELENMSQQAFYEQLYSVNNTFGFAEPEGHQKFAEMTDAHVNDLQWYTENQHPQHVKAIVGYLIGYSLYAFSLPEPTKALLLMYYKIIENDFFYKLGYDKLYKSGYTWHVKRIKHDISQLLSSFKVDNGKVIADTSMLDVSSEAAFSKSFLFMVRNLQYVDEFV
jgi:hypothetical protein